MKNRLASRLRATFGFLRVLIVIAAIFSSLDVLKVVIVHFFWKPADLSPQMVLLPYVEIYLPDKTVSLTTTGAPLNLKDVHAALQVDAFSRNSGLAGLAYWSSIPFFGAVFIYAYITLGYLRNLFANAETGEIFCESNLHYIRRLAQMMIGYSLFGLAWMFVIYLVVGINLAQKGAFTGLTAGASVGLHWNNISISHSVIEELGSLITGFIILLVGEAFRQGMALKQDSELTV